MSWIRDFAVALCISSTPLTAQETVCPARLDEPGFIRRVQEKIVKLLESDFDWNKAFTEKPKAKIVSQSAMKAPGSTSAQ